MAEIWSLFLQFVVYLATANAEIEAVTRNAYDKENSRVNPIPQVPTEKDKKTKVSNVGYRFGSEIRRQRKESANGNHSTGKGGGKGVAKSPHIRRSHFHSFWKGSGDDKQLIVKWVNSVFVNGKNTDDDVTTTIHKVF